MPLFVMVASVTTHDNHPLGMVDQAKHRAAFARKRTGMVVVRGRQRGQDERV
jgi:hypothetical protein